MGLPLGTKDPVHPGVYPRLSVVLPGVNVSDPVIPPLGSVYGVDPVETNKPPDETLAPDALVSTLIDLASKQETVPVNRNAIAEIRISWFSARGF
jgi:hypothetical protein